MIFLIRCGVSPRKEKDMDRSGMDGMLNNILDTSP